MALSDAEEWSKDHIARGLIDKKVNFDRHEP